MALPPLQALPNGAPASSKPSSPALIETKESNGSVHTSGSTSEEPEEQDAQVCAGLRARVWAGDYCRRKSPVLRVGELAASLGSAPC